MNERVPPPSAMCQVCQQILTPVVMFEDVWEYGHDEPTGQLEVLSYNHPADRDEDHDPVPGPVDLAQAVAVCDGCSSREPTAGYVMATPFTVRYAGIQAYDDGQWACCRACITLIEADDWDALEQRAAIVMTARHGPEARPYLHALHDAFRRAYLGEIHDTPQSL